MKKFASMSFLLFLLPGCFGTSLQVRINALSSGQSFSKFYIMPGNKDITESDLQFQEYALYVKRGLEKKGFQAADSVNQAEMIIYVQYAISDPRKHRRTINYDALEYQPGQTYNFQGQSNYYGNYQGQSQYHGTIQSDGQYVTKTKSYNVEYETFIRQVRLTAIDAKKFKLENKFIPVWQTDMISEGRTSDLRKVLPNIIAASYQYFGERTDSSVRKTIYDHDKEIVYIKTGKVPTKEREE